MRELFEELKLQRFAAVERIVANREIETVQLEFKSKDDPSRGELTKADRAVLGPALGALANSAGGLLVIGIDARRNERGVEATDLKPITGLARFKTDLVRASGELLIPRHEAIEIVAIEQSADVGFVAIWVEKSDRRPHMSQNEKRYYKRAGDSSYRMEHHDVEDAFNRVAPPELRLGLSGISKGATSDDRLWRRHDYRLEFSLVNDGRLSACAPYVTVEAVVGGQAVSIVSAAHGVSMLAAHTYGQRHLFSGDANVFVHPGLSLPAYSFNFAIAIRNDGRSYVGSNPARDAVVSFDYSYGCQHRPNRTGVFRLAGIELEDFPGTPTRFLVEQHQPRDR